MSALVAPMYILAVHASSPSAVCVLRFMVGCAILVCQEYVIDGLHGVYLARICLHVGA